MSNLEYYVTNVAFPSWAAIHADLTAHEAVYSFFSTISNMNHGLRWIYQRVGGKLSDEAVVSSLWHDSIYLFLLASSHWWCSYLRLLAFIMLSFVVNFIVIALCSIACSKPQASQGINISVLKIHKNIRPKRKVLVLLSLMHSRWTGINLSECLFTYHCWNHRSIYRRWDFTFSTNLIVR